MGQAQAYSPAAASSGAAPGVDARAPAPGGLVAPVAVPSGLVAPVAAPSELAAPVAARGGLAARVPAQAGLTTPVTATAATPAPMDMAALAALPGLWRGDALARVGLESLPSGYPALDAELPGGGWPMGALTEILNSRTGIGELRLFFPALAALARSGAPLILLQPPYAPYAPAFAGAGIAPAQVLVLRARKLEDALWACEQCLKYTPRGALFAWPQRLAPQDLRRLQLAVEGRPVLAVLMRERQAAQQSSAAALRIALEPGNAPQQAGQLTLRILKRRGGTLERPIVIEPPAPLPAQQTAPVPPLQQVPAVPPAQRVPGALPSHYVPGVPPAQRVPSAPPVQAALSLQAVPVPSTATPLPALTS